MLEIDQYRLVTCVLETLGRVTARLICADKPVVQSLQTGATPRATDNVRQRDDHLVSPRVPCRLIIATIACELGNYFAMNRKCAAISPCERRCSVPCARPG